MITRFGPGGCYCCGCIAWIGEGADQLNPRCHHHLDRNPCVIEGCTRTTARSGPLRNDQWICSIHWRAYVPPRSALRRAYHRFFRIAKREGWTPELRRRFWRFWDGIVARVRRMSTEGTIDEKAIAEMFGWDLD